MKDIVCDSSGPYAGKRSSMLAHQGNRRRIEYSTELFKGSVMAGVDTSRIAELVTHTRKRTDPLKCWGSSVRDLLVACDGTTIKPHIAAKRSQLIYCGSTAKEQRQHFETRWKPVDGRMAFCTGRKSGSATVECPFEQLDRDSTYHTWKRIVHDPSVYGSHLQFDRFLTVDDSAPRSDRLPRVVNRAPPMANTDGPFEKPILEGHIDSHLDRTWTPKEDPTSSKHSKRGGYGGAGSAARASHLETSTLRNVLGLCSDDMRRSLVRRNPDHYIDHAFDFVRADGGPSKLDKEDTHGSSLVARA